VSSKLTDIVTMGVKKLSERLKKSGFYRSVHLENRKLSFLDANDSDMYRAVLGPASCSGNNPETSAEAAENDESTPSSREAKRLKQDHPPELRVGVDVSMWLAGVSFAMSEMLVDERYLTAFGRALMEQEDKTAEEQNLQLEQEYVFKCSQKVIDNILNLRDKCGISCSNIIIIFDGATPPAKHATCCFRRKRKEDANVIQNGAHLDPAMRIRAAKTAGAPPHLHAQIIQKLLHELRCHDIPFLVAPYESDSQLMYLSKMGWIDLILSPDSDLVAMSAPALLRNLDMDTLCGEMIRRRDLGSCYHHNFDLSGFTDTHVALMCVAAGCDYCDSLPQVGIVHAHKAVRQAIDEKMDEKVNENNPPVTNSLLRRFFEALYQSSSFEEEGVDKGNYEQSFIDAMCMYLHPVVFDLTREECIFARNPVTHSDSILKAGSDYYCDLCKA
jgi:5'-3' exonuclease